MAGGGGGGEAAAEEEKKEEKKEEEEEESDDDMGFGESLWVDHMIHRASHMTSEVDHVIHGGVGHMTYGVDHMIHCVGHWAGRL